MNGTQYTGIVSLVFQQPYTGMIFIGARYTALISGWRPCFGGQLGRSDWCWIWPGACKLFVFKVFFSNIVFSISYVSDYILQVFQVSSSESCLPPPVW